MNDLKVGDAIKAKANTLAYFNGDINGTVEEFEGERIMCRMNYSGRIVPFRREQLERFAAQDALYDETMKTP